MLLVLCPVRQPSFVIGYQILSLAHRLALPQVQGFVFWRIDVINHSKRLYTVV